MIKKAKLNHKDLFHAPIFRAAYHKIFWAQKTPTTTTAPIFLNYFAQLEQKTSNIIQVFFICISKMLLWNKKFIFIWVICIISVHFGFWLLYMLSLHLIFYTEAFICTVSVHFEFCYCTCWDLLLFSLYWVFFFTMTCG